MYSESLEIFRKSQEKVNKVLAELGPPSLERRNIIKDRFGGFMELTTYSITQLSIGFMYDKEFMKTFMQSPVKSSKAIAMIKASVELGYLIAEEKYEQKIKMLDAKIMIAEVEAEKLRRKDE